MFWGSAATALSQPALSVFHINSTFVKYTLHPSRLHDGSPAMVQKEAHTTIKQTCAYPFLSDYRKEGSLLMQMRRARVKSSLPHIKMARLVSLWILQIIWTRYTNLQTHLPSALCSHMRKALCLLGLDHWLILLQWWTKSGSTSLGAHRNNRQLPVLGKILRTNIYR